jgi:hypothetical protein
MMITRMAPSATWRISVLRPIFSRPAASSGRKRLSDITLAPSSSCAQGGCDPARDIGVRDDEPSAEALPSQVDTGVH